MMRIKAKAKDEHEYITPRRIKVVKSVPSYYLQADIITEINYVLDGKLEEIKVYFELLEQIREAKKLYGEAFDVDFILKVNAEKHLPVYLSGWLQEKELRKAWRVWQCLQMLQLSSKDILELIAVVSSDQF